MGAFPLIPCYVFRLEYGLTPSSHGSWESSATVEATRSPLSYTTAVRSSMCQKDILRRIYLQSVDSKVTPRHRSERPNLTPNQPPDHPIKLET
ncbi:hypothetical protein EYZ11_008912 [Aspergillus tanneri]|uniref:Uncharacterized protein n=1 Tax=Aspergillus tanneri TaxID=1220188 RepID=A0A4S3JBE9_9EURO|nr:hypothetical protein EYZ11_008912 [Aspergillus tanneri]